MEQVESNSSDSCCLTTAVYYVGLIVVLRLLLSIAFSIYRNFVRKGHDLHQRYGTDSWVLVTGATAGIGFQICRYAAEKGLNVVISGRDKDKLVKCEKEIQAVNPKIKTRTLRLDFNETQDVKHYHRVADEVADLDIALLVNNAGVLHCRPFTEILASDVMEMIETNIFGLTMLTQIFINRFQKRKLRSGVVNVSSMGGLAPSPFLQFYTSTKACVTSFTRSLGKEVGSKIDVLCHSPAYVQTKMSKYSSGPHVAKPRDCAHAIFRDLGYEYENFPTIGHELQASILKFLQWISETFYSNFIYFFSKMEYQNKFLKE